MEQKDGFEPSDNTKLNDLKADELENRNHLHFSEGVYPINHYNQRNQGKVLIFYHQTFEHYPKRKEMKKYCEILKKTFNNLNFNVREYVDKEDVLAELDKVKEEEFKEEEFKEGEFKDEETKEKEFFEKCNCLIVIVMTYIAIVDEKFKIYTSKRKTYTMNEVMAKFYSSNCPKLRDTPKVFIFQGFEPRTFPTDNESRIRNKNKLSTILAEKCNLLLSCSYLVHKNRNESENWYIDILCSELDDRKKNLDWLSILTNVRRKFEDKCKEKDMKSVCYFESTLLYKLYLTNIPNTLINTQNQQAVNSKSEIENTNSNKTRINLMDKELSELYVKHVEMFLEKEKVEENDEKDLRLLVGYLRDYLAIDNTISEIQKILNKYK